MCIYMYTDISKVFDAMYNEIVHSKVENKNCLNNFFSVFKMLFVESVTKSNSWQPENKSKIKILTNSRI